MGCKDGWTPELTGWFGWSVNINPMQKELCLCVWVSSSIICWSLLKDISESSFVPSAVLLLNEMII